MQTARINTNKASQLLRVCPVDIIRIPVQTFTQDSGSTWEDFWYVIHDNSKYEICKYVGVTNDIAPSRILGKQQSRTKGDNIGLGCLLVYNHRTNKYFVIIHNIAENGALHTQVFLHKKDLYSIVHSIRSDTRQRARQHNTPRKPFLPESVLNKVLHNTINLLLKSRRLSEYNAKIRYGIMLTGPPGNGKSMLCRYLAQLAEQSGMYTRYISASNLEGGFKKDTLPQYFSARKNQSTIVFLDDIDISYLQRTGNNGKMGCAILSAMDGMYDSSGNCVFVFTTNENTDSVDEAFLRPGRIDCSIHLPVPSTYLRKQFIQTWHKDIINNINVPKLVQQTEGKSFAVLDAIRTQLVLNHIVDGRWDLSKAIKEYDDKTPEQKKSVGF